MTERTVDAFVYGLFMDVDLLLEKGTTPVNPRPASVEDFALRSGERATLLSSSGARAFGMLISLTHRDLSRLYSGPGLEQYRRRQNHGRRISAGALLQPARPASSTGAQSGVRRETAGPSAPIEVSAEYCDAVS